MPWSREASKFDLALWALELALHSQRPSRGLRSGSHLRSLTGVALLTLRTGGCKPFRSPRIVVHT